MKRSYAVALREATACVSPRRAWGMSAEPGAVHRATVDARMLQFVIASLPAVLVGLWSQGAALTQAAVLESFLIGLASFAPLLAVAIVVCLAWEVVFARMLDRPADAGWLMTAWLYTALLPPWMPLQVAALGITVGVVFGSHIFGGTGRYLVSPALLGAAFVNVSYPSLFAEALWRENLGAAPVWDRIANGDVAELAQSDITWTSVFAGAEVAVFGVPSALLCVLGAAYLTARGVASWRTVAGGIAGLILVSFLLNTFGSAETRIPWHWHLATGSVAFGLAFIATDPTTMPLTKLTRWVHGFLIGALTVVIRTAVPAHPEATLNALLFASLCIPLLDHIIVGARKRAMHRGVRV